MNEELSLLRLPEVIQRTGLSRATIYRFIEKNAFPQPVKILNSRIVSWRSDEIQAWIAKQVTA